MKLMGKPNSINDFKCMLEGLKRKWKLKCGWQLIDIPNDYFIVIKFKLEEDMNDVLYGCSWILTVKTLVVQRWGLNFNHNTKLSVEWRFG